jgi:hypothetical protein
MVNFDVEPSLHMNSNHTYETVTSLTELLCHIVYVQSVSILEGSVINLNVPSQASTVGGKRDTIAPHLHKIVGTVVPDGWHATDIPLIDFACNYLPRQACRRPLTKILFRTTKYLCL